MAVYMIKHSGIKGMKWGIRRYQNKDGSLTPAGKKHYHSTSVSAALARRQNEKIDSSFKKWNENSQKRANAIDLGKKANASRRAYESDKSNKDLKRNYKRDNREYKKALRSNTTYRKGQIKSEVGKDASRKYLSDAKKIEKQLKTDPNNKQLKKEYSKLMSKHDVERAKARRVPVVAANRSRQIASMKRTTTMTVKAAAGTAAAAAGVYAYNQYAKQHGMKTVTSQQVIDWAYKGAKVIKTISKFI